MQNNGYEIVHFQPNMTEGVLQVLRYLWGNEEENNHHYFEWKYNLNLYADTPLGIVALYGRRIVGFRGYFAMRYRISGTENSIVILCPGDTCVYPYYRRKKLSMLMGNMAMTDYAGVYPLFFNFSSNRLSTPGYLKMGFVPLVSKRYLNRYTLQGLIRFILATWNNGKEATTIKTGEFGDIEVSKKPKPEVMAQLALSQQHSSGIIYPDQDEHFFQWRFANHRKEYVFYYCKDKKKIKGYLVIRVSPSSGRGFIIDYNALNTDVAKRLISFPLKQNHLNVMSINAYSNTHRFAPALKKSGFRQRSILRIIERRIEGEWPLLLRPVRETFTEQDFYLGNLDIRHINNWALKEICSDGT